MYHYFKSRNIIFNELLQTVSASSIPLTIEILMISFTVVLLYFFKAIYSSVQFFILKITFKGCRNVLKSSRLLIKWSVIQSISSTGCWLFVFLWTSWMHCCHRHFRRHTSFSHSPACELEPYTELLDGLEFWSRINQGRWKSAFGILLSQAYGVL